MDSRLGSRVVVEATAPACIDLAGGELAFGGGPPFDPEAPAICVAIDRRALCRVETGGSGLQVESKDVPFRAEGRDRSDLLAAGCPPLALSVMRRLGIDSRLSVTMHSRVPSASGLGDAALAVAVAAAVSRAVGADSGTDAVTQLARDVVKELPGVSPGLHRLHGAIQGGVLGFHLGPGAVTAERLATDPGRVEESLMLVDTGALPTSEVPSEQSAGGPRGGSAGGGRDEITAMAGDVARALVGHRYGEIGGLMAREWEARKRLIPALSTAEVDRVVEIARAAGGAARPCSGSGPGWMLVWAPPGERGEGSRERVEMGLRVSGFRILSFRVDLRGLEVE